MALIARHEGREARVSVERSGTHYRVTVDDRAYEIDLERFGAAGRSLIYAGTQHEVSVKPLTDGRYQVASSRGLAEVEVVDPLTHLAREARQADRATGPRRMTADMPGRVVELLVEEGATVEAGDGVLVLEAMKMENEIRSEQPGVVRRFFVQPGEAVESGDDLFEID